MSFRSHLLSLSLSACRQTERKPSTPVRAAGRQCLVAPLIGLLALGLAQGCVQELAQESEDWAALPARLSAVVEKFNFDQEVVLDFADIDGDGEVELIKAVGSALTIYLDPWSSRSATLHYTNAPSALPHAWEVHFADINGDGKDDLINRSLNSRTVFVHYSTGSTFDGAESYEGIAVQGRDWGLAYANAYGAPNNRMDHININRSSGQVFIHQNSGAAMPVTFPTNASTHQAGLAVRKNGSWRLAFANIDLSDPDDELLNINQVANGASSAGNWAGVHKLADPFTPTSIGTLHLGNHGKKVNYFFGNAVNNSPGDELIVHHFETGQILAYQVRKVGNSYYVNDIALRRGFVNAPGRLQTYPLTPDNRITTGEVVMWYEGDNFPESGRNQSFPVTKDARGWFPRNPNYPEYAAPNTRHYNNWTPMIGLYSNKKETTIMQHALWLNQMGVTAIVMGLTNVPCSTDLQNPVYEWAKNFREVASAYYSVFKQIRGFTPPKIILAMRAGIDASNNSHLPAETQCRMDDMAEIIAHGDASTNVYINDGSADRNKPLLIVFPQQGWLTPGFSLRDRRDRFNVRLANGYFGNSTQLYDDIDAAHAVYTSKFPLWNYVENAPREDRKGYHRTFYREGQVNGQMRLEQASAWMALHQKDAPETPEAQRGRNWVDNNVDANGNVVIDLHTGAVLNSNKVTFERSVEHMLTQYPHVATFNRWAYGVAYGTLPMEGLGLGTAAIFEPSEDFGFTFYDKGAKAAHDLRRLARRAPTVLAAGVVGGATLRLRVHGTAQAVQYLNCGDRVIEPLTTTKSGSYQDAKLPAGCRSGHRYRVRNPFGVSAAKTIP